MYGVLLTSSQPVWKTWGNNFLGRSPINAHVLTSSAVHIGSEMVEINHTRRLSLAAPRSVEKNQRCLEEKCVSDLGSMLQFQKVLSVLYRSKGYNLTDGFIEHIIDRSLFFLTE